MNLAPTTQPGRKPRRDPRVDPRLPRGAGKVGMALFLTALAVLFAASMAAYVLIRILSLRDAVDPFTGEVIPSTAPGFGQIKPPITLWLSTLIIMVTSVTMHTAVDAVRRERQARLRTALLATLLLSGFFLLVQTPAMIELLGNRYDAEGGFTAIYGLMFTLVVLHALHVVGGLIPLVVVTVGAHRGRYDHEVHGPVTYLAMYWHFLDLVWIVMFGVLLVAS